MTEWGQQRYITPGVVVRRRADHDRPGRDQPDDPDPARHAPTSTMDERGDVRHPRPARQPGRQAPPLEQGDPAEAAEARLRRQVQLGRVAADVRRAHRHLRRLRHRRRPVRPPVGARRRPAWSTSATRRRPGRASRWCCRGRASKPEMELEWKIPEKSNAIERDRARTYHQAYSALVGAALPGAGAEGGPGRADQVLGDFKVPEEAVSCGFHEAARGVLSHHMVIRGGKVANYQPYPPTPWNGNPRDTTGRPGHTRMRCRTRRSSRRTGPRISRASTSCGRCGASTRACRAACTCTPAGQVRKVVHTPDRDELAEPATGARRTERRRGADRAGPGADGRGRADCRPAPRGRRAGAGRRRARDVRRGLERIVAALDEAGEAASDRERLAGDGIVASLLLIHDLYPVPLEERVGEALDAVRPYMESHGGDVELRRLEEGSRGPAARAAATVARPPRRRSSWRSRRRSRAWPRTWRGSRSRAAWLTPRSRRAELSSTELPVIQAGGAGAAGRPCRSWPRVGVGRRPGMSSTVSSPVSARARGLGRGRRNGARRRQGRGHDARLSRRLRRLRRAALRRQLSEGVLACPGCERRYFLPRAGRSLDDEHCSSAPCRCCARPARPGSPSRRGAEDRSERARRRCKGNGRGVLNRG